MPALIISLVVMVLLAIAVVLRLLIAELSKPATPRRVARPATDAVVAAAGASAGAAADTVTAGVGAGVAAASVATAAPAQIGAQTSIGPSSAGGAVPAPTTGRAPLASPRPTGPVTQRQRKMRMRDVVERGEGVRLSMWRRLRSFVSLIVLVGLLGVGAAAFVGLVIILIGFALEQAIS